jgi:hypothetical protein
MTELEAKLNEIASAIAGIEAREANIRAGYVYVISKLGAFGPDMVKIGMTRRLEPQDRIRELGDASVPFRFDTHAMIFSEDAVGLETRLHAELVDRKVNMIKTRRGPTPARIPRDPRSAGVACERPAAPRDAGAHLRVTAC